MTNLQQGSAKIYQFPVGGRSGLTTRQDGAKNTINASPRVHEAACGSGWYHEAAIEEATRTSEH